MPVDARPASVFWSTRTWVWPTVSAVNDDATESDRHRSLAGAANGAAWEILGGADAALRAEELLDCAHASSYHWRRAVPDGAVQHARAAWLLSRSYAVAGAGPLAERYARLCADLTAESDGAADFDHAYAHEALARAHAACGRAADARREIEAARGIEVIEDEDRAIFTSDLEAEPWFGVDDAT